MGLDDLGWIKMYRKIISSQVFQNDALLKVWIWCLAKATHKPMWVPMRTGRGETEVRIERGQFIFGRKTAAKELKMHQSSVRNRLKKLKDMQNLDIQSNTHYSIVTVLNWDSYQIDDEEEDRQEDNQRTTKGQPKDTYKKYKNAKNINSNTSDGEPGIKMTVAEAEAHYKRALDRMNSLELSLEDQSDPSKVKEFEKKKAALGQAAEEAFFLLVAVREGK